MQAFDAQELLHNIGILEAFGKATDAVHPETEEHSNRVVRYCDALGDRLLSSDEVITLRAAASVHDVGKIWLVRHSMLSADRPLSSEEDDFMKQHPIQGSKILEPIRVLFKYGIPTLVLEHHEREDGSGYPYQRTGRQLSLSSKILAICDIYAALREPRSYRPPQGKPLTYTRPEATKELDKMVREGKLNRRVVSSLKKYVLE